MRYIPCALLIVVSLSAGGCRVAEASSDMAVEPAASRPSEGMTEATDVAEPNGLLTLREAVALALAGNPALKTFPYEMQAAEARVVQARLLPNPELQVGVEEFGGSGELSGFDAAETTVQFGQVIELAGKRAKRTRLASLGEELVRWDYASQRLDVIHAVTRTFVEVLAAQDRLDLAEKMFELSRQAQSAVAQRVEAGKDSPVDELRAGVALSHRRIAVRKATNALAMARHRLAATWGGRAPRFEAASGELCDLSEPASFDQLSERIFENPDVARFKTWEQQRRAALHLEKAKATSDVTVAGGLRRYEATDDEAFVVGVALPIPLFDRNQGGIREAAANLAKVRQQRMAAEIGTLAALSDATGRLSSAFEEVTLLRDGVLPNAQRACEAARQGYREGKFDYLYVLDTQRTLCELQAQLIDVAQAYHQARADAERLAGGAARVSEPPSVNTFRGDHP